MTLALVVTILLPLFGAVGLMLFPEVSERLASRWTMIITVLSSLTALMSLGIWLGSGAGEFRTPELTLVSHGEYRFALNLVLDPAAAVFLFLVEFASGMVIRFSRVYLHREPGFRRFFAIVLMFRGAMSLLALAGNLDLLFVGWELVGLGSFLLIAFYHERGQALRNALKTFSIYRIADVGMLLGVYLEHTAGHTGVGLLLLLAAAGKSAQLPFSFWIGCAMEGPTPSSALFYGALSVHAGAYLLLRTYPIWGDVPIVHICVGVLGLSTAIFCNLFSRAQHTIKGQVGYASVTQVGLVFVELSLGLRWLALVHIFANAVLRCYQLLVSPSAVAYLLRQQSSADGAKALDERSWTHGALPMRLRSTLYVFAISEGYLEELLRVAFWRPARWAGDWLLRHRASWIALGISLTVLFANRQGIIAGGALMLLAIGCSLISLNASARTALACVGSSYLLSAAAVFVASDRANSATELVYGVEVAIFCTIALVAMGASSKSPWMRWLVTFGAFLGVLGIMGFPLLPTFFGEDMLLHDGFRIHRAFAVLLSSVFAFNGYVVMRAFASVFYSGQAKSVRPWTFARLQP